MMNEIVGDWKKLRIEEHKLYCTMLRVTSSVLTTSCTCHATEDTLRIVNSFITIPITRNYNHSQLFLTLLRVYTIIILIRS
jgi:hypothetical protein